MKIFIATCVVLLVAARLDVAASITEAANFLIKAQELLNNLQSQNYDKAVSCADLIDEEMQRGFDAIEIFESGILDLAQDLKYPNLSSTTVIDHVESLLDVVKGRMDQFDLGSQIVAAIVDFNNQIGVLVSSKIQIFYMYLSKNGTAADCFQKQVPRINEDISAVANAIKTALEKLCDDKTAEIDAWIANLDTTLAGMKASRLLTQIDTTVTALVAGGLSSSFWLKNIADLKVSIKIITDDASSRIDRIKKDVEACSL